MAECFRCVCILSACFLFTCARNPARAARFTALQSASIVRMTTTTAQKKRLGKLPPEALGLLALPRLPGEMIDHSRASAIRSGRRLSAR